MHRLLLISALLVTFLPMLTLGIANCTVGVDLATPASVSAFQCMAANGIQHATIRAFQSNCWLDPHAAQTIKNAWAAGLVVDVYVFPSVGCDLDPTSQVQVTLEHLAAQNASFNTLWLDVEDWYVAHAHTFTAATTNLLALDVNSTYARQLLNRSLVRNVSLISQGMGSDC